MKIHYCRSRSQRRLTCFAFFCPNNFNDISIGDPIAKVEQLCGKPDSIVY